MIKKTPGPLAPKFKDGHEILLEFLSDLSKTMVDFEESKNTGTCVYYWHFSWFTDIGSCPSPI